MVVQYCLTTQVGVQLIKTKQLCACNAKLCVKTENTFDFTYIFTYA